MGMVDTTPGDGWHTFFLGVVDTHFWEWLLNTPLWAHWGWWAHQNEATFPKRLILWIPQCPGIAQHVKICLAIAGMFHHVLQSSASLATPRYAPVCPSISLYLDVRPVCTYVASLGVHIIELCQPSPSTASTKTEDYVSENPITTFDWKAFYLSRVPFFFIFNWINQIN